LRPQDDLTETQTAATTDEVSVDWGAPEPSRPTDRRHVLDRLLLGVIALSVVAGWVFRFVPGSALWLDEALSVNIARLSIPELFDALRRDGAPPLYYVLLHGWMRVLGDGDWAVRALSGVFGVAALPVAFQVGRRMGGRWLAWASVVLLATSPFAVRYSSETRMYSLVILLALLGHLAVLRAVERTTPARLAAVAGVVGLLVYTHYWAFFLIAASISVLGWIGWRRRSRSVLLAAAAVVAGSALILPWVPTLLYQSAHTGAPWAYEPEPNLLANQLSVFAGGHTNAGAFLDLALVLLLALGLIGHRRAGAVQLGRPPSGIAMAAAIAFGTLLLGFLSAYPTNGAYAGRYTAIALGVVLLVVARGAVLPPSRRVRLGVLAVTAVLGVLAANALVQAPRTQAAHIASRIVRQGQPGDLVAYCPADLGPSVHRVLPDGFQQLTFPNAEDPALVNWVDYLDRVNAADLGAFARRLVEQAGPDRRLFVVWTPAHGPLGRRCSALLKAVDTYRTRTLVMGRSARFQERALLVRYDP
jgi:mannosyltransferase